MFLYICLEYVICFIDGIFFILAKYKVVSNTDEISLDDILLRYLQLLLLVFKLLSLYSCSRNILDFCKSLGNVAENCQLMCG